ncbi:hypothetical protein SAMN05216551_11579 [Chitinasiproducens palmae]|uniref:Uncharacterized protein n=1 Tax=Chitinasiproducens palmae TaxID=1770053 RepID=A0A1H2PX44_9BURK|nr:hypothetical protein SAMN05216551_11579 [Chitinasiproducens palmae]
MLEANRSIRDKLHRNDRHLPKRGFGWLTPQVETPQ